MRSSGVRFVLVVAWLAAAGAGCGGRPLLLGVGGHAGAGAGGGAAGGRSGTNGQPDAGADAVARDGDPGGLRDAVSDFQSADRGADVSADALRDLPARDGPADLASGDLRVSDARVDGDAAADGGRDAQDARSDATAPRDGVSGAGGSGAGGSGGTPDAGPPPPRQLLLVLDGAPWYATQATQGMAVDANGRVFVSDPGSVFAVDGSTVSTYLTATEVAETGAIDTHFGDMDVGPDGRLYIVLAAYASSSHWFGIARSSIAHQAERWMDLSAIGDTEQISVVADGSLTLISHVGLWTVTDVAGATMVYNATAIGGVSSCATQDLVASATGTFLYQPGCNGSPLMRGHADGSGVAVLYDTQGGSEVQASNFLCSARDPAGGFYFIIENQNDGAPRLYHVTDDAQGTSGLTLIDTTPSFAEARQRASNVFGFRYCSLAAGRDGTVYFQTYAQLWKVTP